MNNLRTIGEAEATGPLAEIYDSWLRANPHRENVPDILKCFGHKPEVLDGVLALSYPLQFSDGFLTRCDKERIATYVSALNQCPY